MSEGNGLEVAGIAGGITTALGMIGAGIAWLAGWADRRTARLAREEDELDESWSAYRKRIEARLGHFEARDAQRVNQMTALRLAFEIVAAELRRTDPTNSALSRAEQLLNAAFPLEPVIPPDMSHSLVIIDGANA